jgi:hypothetical protein
MTLTVITTAVMRLTADMLDRLGVPYTERPRPYLGKSSDGPFHPPIFGVGAIGAQDDPLPVSHIMASHFVRRHSVVIAPISS